MEVEYITNNFLIKIEDKDYFIYESYIRNGTVYTFSIYKSSKCYGMRNNYFPLDALMKNIVIIGKKYNYILERKKENFIYEITKYSKNVLKFYEEDFMFIISLNNDILSKSSGNDNITHALIKEEIKLRNNSIRKQKLQKINE